MLELIIVGGGVVGALLAIGKGVSVGLRKVKAVYRALKLQHDWISETHRLVNYEFKRNGGASALDLIQRIPALTDKVCHMDTKLTTIQNSLDEMKQAAAEATPTT